MNIPTFSVIVPVYNAFDTLEATVTSVLDQSDNDWELILIDDGSTDRSLSLMLQLAAKDERVRAISQFNAGPSAARNLGAQIARGEFLAFLDADDLWSADKLAAHRKFHDSYLGVDASFAQIEFLETAAAGGPTVRTLSTVPNGLLRLTQIVGENPVCTTSNLVVRAGTFAELGGFSVGMDFAEDQEFVARYVDQGFLIMGIDQRLVSYRMMETGLSADLTAMLHGWRALASNYAQRMDVQAMEAVYFRYLARRALRTGAKPKVAIDFMVAGLQIDAAAFLADRRRGIMTILASLSSLFMPRDLRRRVFA